MKRTAALGALVGAIFTPAASPVHADLGGLLAGSIDTGSRLSPLIPGRVVCADPGTVNGTATITVAGRAITRPTVVADACTPDWNPIGVRVPTAQRAKVRAAVRQTRRRAVLLVRLSATSGATTDSMTIRTVLTVTT